MATSHWKLYISLMVLVLATILTPVASIQAKPRTDDSLFGDTTEVREPPSKTVYVIVGGAKIPIPSPEVAAIVGDFAHVRDVRPGTLKKVPNIPREGTLMREISQNPVYRMTSGVAVSVPNSAAVEKFGGWSKVRLIPDGTLMNLGLLPKPTAAPIKPPMPAPTATLTPVVKPVGLTPAAAPIRYTKDCAIQPYGDIKKFYDWLGGRDSSFGCAKTPEYEHLGGRAQDFDWGQILWKQSGDHVLTMGAYQSRDFLRIFFVWSDSAKRDFYRLRYRQDYNDTIETDEINSGQIIGPVYWPNSTFRFYLNGCEKEHVLFARSGSKCYGWTSEVVLVTHPNTPPPPAPAPAPVSAPPPVISVTPLGNRYYHITASNLAPNEPLNLRIVYDDGSGVDTASGFENVGTLKSDGTFASTIKVLCYGSLNIHFSAQHLSTLVYSKIVHSYCQ